VDLGAFLDVRTDRFTQIEPGSLSRWRPSAAMVEGKPPH
jgi:hypothetical protein